MTAIHVNELIWETVMQKDGKYRNGFFRTQKEAIKFYHEWHSVGWEGQLIRHME